MAFSFSCALIPHLRLKGPYSLPSKLFTYISSNTGALLRQSLILNLTTLGLTLRVEAFLPPFFSVLSFSIGALFHRSEYFILFLD
jgi:hypothetical protein